MSSTPLVRRTVTISAGALTLCLFTGGVSFADTGLTSGTGLPGVPSPTNVVTVLEQTVTQVTTTTPTTSPTPTGGGTTTTGGTTGGTTGTTTGTSTGGTTTTKAPGTSTRTTTTSRRLPSTTPQAVTPATGGGTTDGAGYVAMPAPMSAGLALPPATTSTPVIGSAPAVAAPLLIPRSGSPASTAGLLAADRHTGSPVRGLLLTLAIGAAVGLGYEHLRLARRGLGI